VSQLMTAGGREFKPRCIQALIGRRGESLSLSSEAAWRICSHWSQKLCRS